MVNMLRTSAIMTTKPAGGFHSKFLCGVDKTSVETHKNTRFLAPNNKEKVVLAKYLAALIFA